MQPRSRQPRRCELALRPGCGGAGGWREEDVCFRRGRVTQSQPPALPRSAMGWRAAQNSLVCPRFQALPSVTPLLGRAAGPGLCPLPRAGSFLPVWLRDHPKTPMARPLAPCSPPQHPHEALAPLAQGLGPGLLCLEREEGQRDPSKGQETEAVSRCQAGDSQQTEGICPRDRLAVPHQEAAIPSSLGQQLLCHHPADVPVVPACCCHPPKRWDTSCALSLLQPHIGAQQQTPANAWHTAGA